MNIAFVVDAISNSDLSYGCVSMINKMVNDNSVSPVIFYQNLYPPLTKPMCLLMNINSMSSYSGTIIATDLNTADIVRKNNTRCDKWLYLWNINWLSEVLNYEIAVDIMKDFKIIVRDHEMKSIVKNFCGKDSVTLENFNWEKLRECLKIKKNT